MKRRFTFCAAGLAFCALFFAGVVARAQNREKYVISARAGGVNYVSGNVTVRRGGTDREEAVIVNDDLRSGDVVTTAARGKVEVLLNPGSYLRVSENSEFELSDTALDNLIVKLVKGSAVVEVTGEDSTKFEIRVATPQTEVLIVRRGIYRLNVLPNDLTELYVRKGQAFYGVGASEKVKGGKKVLIRRSTVEVVKLDKSEQDQLDLWSEERAEALAQANRKLRMRNVASAFMAMNSWDAASLGFSSSSSRLGLWVYEPAARGYCFLPFGARSWSSPYGHNYPNGVWTGGRNGWNPGSNNGGGGWTGNNGGGNNGGGNSGGGNSGGGNNGGGNSVSPPSPPPSAPPSPPPAASSHIQRAGNEVGPN